MLRFLHEAMRLVHSFCDTRLAEFGHSGSTVRATMRQSLVEVQRARWEHFERGEKTPTPKISALLRTRPVLLRANFVLSN